MAFNPLPIKIPPGMFRNGTNYESMGRWYDGNLVRWENGRLKPIQGWVSQLAPGAALTGVARGGVAWSDNNGFRYIAIGTNSKLYVGTAGIYTDVTPAGLVVGRVDTILGAGYGSGPYGENSPPDGTNTYGTQRSLSVTGLELDAATWSFDTYGQDMLGVLTSDQNIWQYDPSTGLVTKQSSSAPTAISVMVTNEDYILALGAGGVGRQIKWPDISNPTTWTPAITNTAGGIPLNTGGRCMSGTRVGTQNLVWTNMDVHAINYIGTPGIYGPTRLAEGCGLVGPNAFAVTDIAYWWSWGGFFTYNGIVQPLPCDVQDYIWRQVDWTQTAKIYGETNTRFNEVTFFFPSVTGNPLINGECDSYITYNYKSGIWYYGVKSQLARTTWVDKGVWPLPIAVDASGVVYEQETGYLANGATRVPNVYATSGPIEINGGKFVSYVDLVIPDVDPNPNAVELSVLCQNAPDGPVTTIGPAPMIPNAEGYFPIQFAGRQAALKIQGIADEDWSFGTMRVSVKGKGSR